jgi:hypothetical protein
MRNEATVTPWICVGLFAVLPWLATSAAAPVAETWRERVQLVDDADAGAVVRRRVRVVDPHPDLPLDFVWRPRRGPGIDRDGVAQGRGALSWYERGEPAYDQGALYSIYRGDVHDGRPDGRGVLDERSGLSYRGEWKAGRMHGRGVLIGGDSARYDGDFVAGFAEGHGRETLPDGSLYDGPFVAGHRDGIAILTLVGGDRYVSTWHAGIETDRRPLEAGARPPRADPPPLYRLAQATGGVRLAVYVDRRRNKDFEALQAADGAAAYVYGQSAGGDGMHVELASKKIMGLWKGDDTIDLGSADLFEAATQFAPVFLELDLKNEGSAVAQVVGSRLDVAASTTDPQPYLVLGGGGHNDCTGGTTLEFNLESDATLGLANYGWGAVQNARLTYAFGKKKPATEEFTVQIGSFDESKRFSAEAGLKALGVDIGALAKQRPRCPSVKAVPGCLEQLKHSGALGRLADHVFTEGADATDPRRVVTQLHGTLTYDWKDAEGRGMSRRSPVAAVVPLFVFEVEGAGPECGAMPPAEGGFKPVKLALDKKDYRVPLSYRATLKAQENRRFELTVSAERSSRHRFQVVVELSDGATIKSSPIDLVFFTPRTVLAPKPAGE